MSYHSPTERWVACGYINLQDTLCNIDYDLRLCSSLLALGLLPPQRLPVAGKDYIVEGAVENMEALNGRIGSGGIGGLRSDALYETESIYVDLFADEACTFCFLCLSQVDG